MKEVYVSIGKDGYVQEWCDVGANDNLPERFIKILADGQLMYSDSARVVDGIAVLDKQKQQTIREDNKELIEQIQEEIEAM
ncbi:hypothetical protein EP56_05805 [Listeriaceae bacterium FSL A5-0209]|nr:hypothetical protein EP56_05805 [Listeriaceae bacterium FSL A5-0209]